ncbi:MAG TPA: HAMP domain-containing sensor histidine kinase [Candidatus Dormibacteraeota bacterium]|nr:HAMP domain-containing sensor histidine kinase [Candidatus Dormibacteraeota bacterium]
MTLSLRGRLLVGVITLMIVGLTASSVATYAMLEKSLVGRLDAQLDSGRVEATAALNGSQRGPSPTRFPTDTVVEHLDHDGNVVDAKISTPFGGTPSSARPVVPKNLPSRPTDTPADPFTVPGIGGIAHFRMTYWPEDSLQGDIVVLAIPMTDVDATLSQLLELEAGIGAAILLATVGLAFAIIQIGLRPLQRMGAAAGEIAAGDYSRRVEPATPKTEIGRLGLALNAMLAQIEAAFAERTASEGRLRRFIADASHELRTPLTSIRGYSEMLRRGAEESPADAELARRRIEEESVRMSALVDDMLLIARLDQGRPLESKPVDLQVIARDAAADARAVAPDREIALEAPDTVLVSGDDTRLRQVVGNLVRNALVHTPATSPLEIAVTSHNGTARLSVADHGPGLPPGDRERIFEPFYRADASRSRDSGGAGLGLSIASAVVAAHGGRVKVRETQGGGATFDVELPLVRS